MARAADTARMIVPAAALAVLLLGFVVVYGSVLQARIESGVTGSEYEDAGGLDTDIS